LGQDAPGTEHNTEYKDADHELAREWHADLHIFINVIQLFNHYFLILPDENPDIFCCTGILFGSILSVYPDNPDRIPRVGIHVEE
jgi:hypothetical protein